MSDDKNPPVDDEDLDVLIEDQEAETTEDLVIKEETGETTKPAVPEEKVVAAKQMADALLAPDPEPAKMSAEEKEAQRLTLDLKAVEEFRDLSDPASPHFKATKRIIQQKIAEGYDGPDLIYEAARAAYNAPDVSAARNAERAREERIKASSGFEKPSRMREEQEDRITMTPTQARVAQMAGITTQEGMAEVKRALRQAALEARRHGDA